MSDRYYVIETTGWRINVSEHAGTGRFKPSTSYAVLDRINCHREAGTFYSDVTPGGHCRRRAYDLCDTLNARHRAAEQEAA